MFGPTGVGKTAVALALADLLRARGEDPIAISADALQVYAGLETLTAAPTDTERARLEHRLVGVVPMTETFSVGEFMPLAHREIDAALAGGRRPIVVGGTGLYLRAALTELDLRPPPAPGVRERVARELAARGPRALHAELAERAPSAAARIAATDRARIGRAHELLAAGEDPLAADALGEESQLWSEDMRRPTLLVGLVAERAELYRRIEGRVDTMVAHGAAEEARRAVAAGASPTACKALGFDELLGGDVEGLKRRTRNLAKRQLTWMRRLAGVRAIDVTGREPTEVAAEVAARL
ncbi:MAG TPA: tRNA (adenosine(37)-N6)-dimethylallyltransferase MiaA [Thermoleophilaceae bacterium]|nr:tRNA (adenosine(37)-N6)-dimethylallyltransferase MiaA [Thermoleophilaceae bacterium]